MKILLVLLGAAFASANDLENYLHNAGADVQVAFIAPDGSVKAQTGIFEITADEAKTIANKYDDEKYWRSSGIQVEGKKYETSLASPAFVYGMNADMGGVVMRKPDKVVVVAVFTSAMSEFRAIEFVKEIARDFKELTL